MNELKPRHKLILEMLSKKIYKKYERRLMKKGKPYAEVEFVLEKVLEEPDLDPEKRKQFELIKKAGIFSKVVEYADPEIEKKMSKELDREIKKYIKAGILPKPDDNQTEEASSKDTPIIGK